MAVLLVFACSPSAPAGSSLSPSPAAPLATATSSPTPVPVTPTPEASPSGTAEDLSFTSTIYPYSIALPADAFQPGPIAMVPSPGTWRSASEMWDGTSVISPSNPQPNDSTLDTDGDELFVAGHRTEDDLEAFVARMTDDFATWHDCSRTPASRATELDGEPAILIGSACGQGGIAVAARLFVVHEGYGLVFSLRSLRPVRTEDQMGRLARYVAEVDLLP